MQLSGTNLRINIPTRAKQGRDASPAHLRPGNFFSGLQPNSLLTLASNRSSAATHPAPVQVAFAFGSPAARSAARLGTQRDDDRRIRRHGYSPYVRFRKRHSSVAPGRCCILFQRKRFDFLKYEANTPSRTLPTRAYLLHTLKIYQRHLKPHGV